MNSRQSAPPSRMSERWGERNTAGVAIASSLFFDEISHTYGADPVLSDITIEVEAGEVLCLLGPSGSGKTTLLRIAAGIDKQSSGTVWIDKRVVSGEGVHALPEKRGIGLVFQDHALFPHLTILQNVMFGLKGQPRRMAEEQARRIISRVGLEQYVEMYPHQLSGGEQQRVALARALAPRPGILLMDEPFSGLDARLRDSVREETLGLLRDTRSTAIIVTHDPEEALRVADRIALMRQGRLVQHGTGKELYYHPASLFAARFFSELNLFHTVANEGIAPTPLGGIDVASHADGETLAICVRLSDVAVVPFSGSAKTFSGVPGRIASRRFLGTAELLEIYVEGFEDPIRARIRAGALPSGATNVLASVAKDSAMVFPHQ